MRRTRLTDRAQRRLWPDWRHHAFLTDLAVPARLVNRAGTPTLRGPLHWPWAGWFAARLTALRALSDTG